MVGISRQTSIRIGDLTPAERAELEPQLVDIVVASYENAPRDVVAERVVFRSPDTRLLLLWSREGELAGFGSLGSVVHDVGSRKFRVIDSGIYAKPGTRGAIQRMALWGTAQTLRQIWANRGTGATICCVTEAVSPASYRAAANLLPEMHPRRDAEIPDEITELVVEVLNDRGMAPRNGDPWRVGIEEPVRFRDEARIQRFVERSTDPNVDFFVKRNPGYLEGDWLVVYIPISLKSTFTSAAIAIRQILQSTLKHKPRSARATETAST